LSIKPLLLCENEYIDKFIQNTKSKNQYCDDFIEWIPCSDIKKNDKIKRGGFSEVFSGKWIPFKQDEIGCNNEIVELPNVDIVLKVLKGSENFEPKFLDEFKIHYKCLEKGAVPFYGLTKSETQYAMVMKRAIHVEPEKVEPEKVEPEKVEPEKVEPEKVEPEKVELEKVVPEKVEPEKVEHEKVEPEKLEPEKLEHGKVEPEPEKVEPEKVEPEKMEPEKVEPEKVEPEKVEPEKVEPQKVEFKKVEPEKAEPEKVEPEKVEPEKLESEKPEKVEPQKVELEKLEPEKVEPEKMEPEKVEPEKVEPEKVEPEKVEPEKVEPEKVEPKKVEPEKVEPQKVEPEKVEPEKMEPEKVEPEKVEPVKVEPVKVESVKVKPEKVELEKWNSVLLEEVSEDVYEGTPNGIDVWVKLSTKGQIHYKAKFFPLEPLPKPTSDFLANLKEKPFDLTTFFVLVTLQAPNGGFPPSDTLANLFGYDSQEPLLQLYESQCHEERILKKTPTVWTSSMILWFLRFLLKDYRSEWGGVYERAEQYISKEVNDLEVEEIAVATGKKAVCNRFDIKLDGGRKKQLITRETLSVIHVKRILKCQQQNNGAYQVTDELAKSFGYENIDKLCTAFNDYKNRHSKSQKISQISMQTWMSIIVLYFYRYVAIDQKKKWHKSYEKTYRWIWAQFKGNESLIQEASQIVQSFIKEWHGVKDDVLEMDRQFENSISEMVSYIKYPQKDRGGGGKNINFFDIGDASDPYVKISNIANNRVYGDSRVIYNNCNPVWEQVFYIPVYDIHEKFNLHVFDYNAFFKDTRLGSYILDLKSIIKELPNGSLEGKKSAPNANLLYKGSNRGKLSFVAEFFSLPEPGYYMEIITTTNVSIKHLYLLMTYQLEYGCFELTDSLARLFNFSFKDELIKAFSEFVKNDEDVRNLDHNIWGTVLVTSFLNALLWDKRHEWLNVYNRAETWLSENAPDIEVEERLYNYSNKFVIQHFNVSEWASEDQKSNLGLIAESLGFSNVDDAKKHFEAHFSSHSPRIAQLDAHIWSTAILIWYLRYVLVDFRREWAEVHQKAYDWLCQQVKDDNVREELLEAARIFVVKRFEVDQGAKQEDESFKDSLIKAKEAKEESQHNRTRGVHYVDEEPQEIEEFVLNDDYVGVIKIVVKCAKDLRKSNSWFTFSNPDPYVRIINAAGNEMVRTSVNYRTVNPVWDEILYIPIHGPGEKISFEIFDENLFVADRLLGTYELDTSVLFQNNEHKPKNEWFPLQIGNEPVKGKLNFEYQFFTTSFTEGDDFVFTRESIKLQHLYILISWRNSNGSFEFSDKLARFFNYKSCDELKESFTKHVSSDNDLLNYDLSIWSTALTIIYFKVLCWKFHGEWKRIIKNSEDWVSKEINNFEIEDRLIDLCKKFVIVHFKVNINNLDKAQLEIINPVKQTIITRKIITIRYICTLIAHQNKDGYILLNEKVADYYGFKSVDEFILYLKKYFKTEHVTKVHYNVWVTACTIWYLRLVAVDHRLEWISNYEKLSEWLTKQYNGDTELENEIMRCAREFIVSRYEVDKDAIEIDNSFIKSKIYLSGTIVSRETTNDKTVKDFITCRTKKDHYELDDNIAQHLGFLNKESLEVALQIHFLSEDVSKLHNDILVTAVSIWYLRLVAVDHREQWSTDCDTLYKWLSSQIKNLHIERKLYGSAKNFAINQYKINDDVIELDTPYQDRSTDFESAKTINDDDLIIEPIKEPKKSFFHEIYSATTKLGDQIEDALTFNKDDHDDHEKAEALIIIEELASPEKWKEIISDQKDDGCIELSDSICNELDAPKEEVITTIQKKISYIKLKSPEFSSSLATAINISYLKKAASQHKDEWEDIHNKAREYLSKQIGDADVEKELLECADNYVVENCIKKVIKDKKRNAVVTIQDSTTPEKCEDAVSNQNDDGFFEVNETICNELDIPVTNVVTTVKKSTTNKKLKSPESESWWKTAIIISYLKVTAPHHENQWKDKCDKAREYLSKQIGDADAEKEILDCTDKYVVDNVTKKFEKDHKKNVAITVIQELSSPEKSRKIVSNQKEDGSIELDDSLCTELDVPKEEIITTIKEKVTNAKLKSPEFSSALATAINLSYLKNAASQYKDEWEDKYNKGCEHLSYQIGDKEAEEELIECADKYVVDNVTNKIIEERKKDVIALKGDEIPKELKKEPKKDDEPEKKKELEAPKTAKYENHEKSDLGNVYKDPECEITPVAVEETRNAVYETLCSQTSPDDPHTLISSQNNDGSFALHTLISDHLLIPVVDVSEPIKSYVRSPRLKGCDTSVWNTAFTITYLNIVLIKYESDWQSAFERAAKWVTEQINDTELEEELYSACEQYLFQLGSDKRYVTQRYNFTPEDLLKVNEQII
ncbi:2128_t:CDS:10, partial [Scutellospora calospora]